MYLKRLRTYRRLGYSLISDMTVEKQNANTIYDSGNYTDIFERDLVEAEKRIIISSPLIEQDKIDRFLYIIKPRQEAGCKVTVITSDPETSCFSGAEYYYSMIRQMQAVGIHVITKDRIDERFAVVDDELVWHGGMNLLGKEDAWDNLMRIKFTQVAGELLELSLGNKN